MFWKTPRHANCAIACDALPWQGWRRSEERKGGAEEEEEQEAHDS